MTFISPGIAEFARRARSAWLVLIGTVMVSAIAAQYVASTSGHAERIQYDNAIHNAEHEIQDSIDDRIGTHIGLLRGAAALFAADGTVTRRQFHDYVARLNLRREYPGVLGIGFCLWVKPGEEDAVEEDMQDQGLGAFHIWPTPGGGEAKAITYLEPLDTRNQLALGYNMGSEPARRQAMDRARDTGLPAASGKVVLLQQSGPGADQSAGFIIFVPVYLGGEDPGTVELRQKNLVGFVFSPFRVQDLLHGIGGNGKLSLVDYTVYDQEFSASSHLHHTGEILSGPSRETAGHKPDATATLDIAGRNWMLAFRSRPELSPRPARALPLAVFGIGCAFALVLFWVMASQAKSRAAAEQAVAELSRSEAALRQSQASLRRLVESNLIGVVISDSQGKIIEANNAFLSITGYTRENLIDGKLNRAALTAPEYAERDREALEQLQLMGSHAPFEKQYIRKDGTQVPVLVGTTSVEGDARTRISFVVDLSELRQARGAVEESERRFRTLVEQSPLGIQIFAPDGKMLLANRAWERIWESKLDELAGYNVLEDQQLEKMGLKPYVLQAFAGAAVEIPPFRYDPALNGRSGRPRWINVYLYPVKDQAGRVRETALIMQDVTAVKVAEEALQRSEEQLRLVIDALPALVSYIDQDKRYRLINQMYEEWFDLPASEINGKHLREIIGEEGYQIAGPNMDRALAGERISYERKMRFPDGSIHEVQSTLIPHVGLADHVEGIVALVVDITERKRAEKERARLLSAEREARSEAETANRIKDEFLATLSHELRTPLNAILGWTQLLKIGGLPPDEISHGLDTIERNAKVQAQLVEDLLDLSRIISGKLRLDMRPIDLPGVLDAALDSVRPAAKAKGIQMIPLLDASASPVLGDAGRLQQVVWNLLSNAIKFTPPRGRVELLLQRVDGHAEILVSDTGIGIHPDFLPYVFERLRQADSSSTRRHGGLGLGLSIARHLIESHGGTIRAESAGENRGATFIVSLPLTLNAQVKDDRSTLSDSPSDSKLALRTQKLQGVRVLVVDDEADARDLVSRILRQDGAEVRAARSAAEALGAIEEQNPDVLVSDIAMPGEDGYELIRKLRLRDSSHGGHVPAIALTALARTEDRERALKAGYHAHLPKPVQPIELASAVAELARH